MGSETARYDGHTVQIIDRENHRGNAVVQIEGVDADLSDPSGNPPWVPANEVRES